MDNKQKEENRLQSLGAVGICTHSFKIIWKHPKSFLQTSAALIVPQALLALIVYQLTLILLGKIVYQVALEQTLKNFPTPEGLPFKTLPLVNAFWTKQLPVYSLLDMVFLLIYFALCVLSTSAITYIAAHTAPARSDHMGFKMVMRIIPRAWKSVAITFLWIFAAVIVCELILALSLAIMCAVLLGLSSKSGINVKALVTTAMVFVIPYLVALVYIRLIASVALVISVLEEETRTRGCGGYGPLVKSKALLEGKVVTALAIFLMFSFCTSLVQSLLDKIMASSVLGVFAKVGVGALCFTVMVFLFVYWYVLQTVLYTACKSYHSESIEKKTIILSDIHHLQSGADYIPLTKAAHDQITMKIDLNLEREG